MPVFSVWFVHVSTFVSHHVRFCISHVCVFHHVELFHVFALVSHHVKFSVSHVCVSHHVELFHVFTFVSHHVKFSVSHVWVSHHSESSPPRVPTKAISSGVWISSDASSFISSGDSSTVSSSTNSSSVSVISITGVSSTINVPWFSMAYEKGVNILSNTIITSITIDSFFMPIKNFFKIKRKNFQETLIL